MGCAHGAGIGDAAIVNNPAGAFGAGPSAIGKEICVYCTPEEPYNWKRVVGAVSIIRHASIRTAGSGNYFHVR